MYLVINSCKNYFYDKKQLTIMKKNCFILSAILFFNFSYSQQISDDVLHKRWDAFWIAVPNAPLHDYGVYHFRKSFSLDQKSSSFIIHVSADNRYKLFVNGTMVSFGSVIQPEELQADRRSIITR